MGCSSSIQDDPTQLKKSMERKRVKKSSNSNEEDLAEIKTAKDLSDIKSKYIFNNIIGRGAFGTTYQVKNKDLGDYRVIRILPKYIVKSYVNDLNLFNNELEILKGIDHINIIKFFDIFACDTNYYIIMELAKGGNLFDIMVKQPINEPDVAYIIKQVLAAASHLHQYNIFHRNIRPETILLETKKVGDYSIKLNCFDISILNNNPDAIDDLVNLPIYFSPEAIKNKYSHKSDIWSCGVILYMLLTGNKLYKGSDRSSILDEIEKFKISYDGKEWEKINPKAKDLVKKLLEPNENKRLNAEEALAHPWIVTYSDSNKIDNSIFNKLTAINSYKSLTLMSKIQQACISFLIREISCSEDTKYLRKIFNEMDRSGEGKLSKDEIREAYYRHFKNSKFTLEEFETLIKFSMEGNDYIMYEDFLRATIDMGTLLSEKNLRMAFEHLDDDKSGKISQEEIKKSLGKFYKKSMSKMEKGILDDFNDLKKKEIDFQDFKDLMIKKMMKGINNDSLDGKDALQNPKKSKSDMNLRGKRKTITKLS